MKRLACTSVVVGFALIPACAPPCGDDGLAGQQELCPIASASESESQTGSDTDSNSDSNTLTDGTASETQGTATQGTATQGMTMTAGPTESESESETAGDDLWCVDGDMDGFGDPDMCMNVPPGQDPPDGSVNNDDDCDDDDENTFPGAAPNDDPDACMTDADDDDWGDDSPGSGVDPGSDCDDNDAGVVEDCGPKLWCLDVDMDGFGDPLTCMMSIEPIPGSVDNGDDCDDLDPNTFPGSAPNDDPDACMTDADDDDWGDDDPAPGVEPGSDCDDSDQFTFPGAAESEDPNACMRDEDDDGWGDTSVPDGVDVGSDCYDTNADLNPADRVFYSFMGNGEVQEIDPMDGSMSVYTNYNNLGINNDSLITAAVNPDDGMIYASQTNGQDRIWVLDYCSDDDPIELMPHGLTLCGLAFTPEGVLYGIDSDGPISDDIVEIDPNTGAVLATLPITVNGLPLDIGACGMAYDCVNDQLLLTHGSASQVLSIDPLTGIATVVADIPEGNWGSVGLEYDPVTKRVFTNNGDELFDIEIDGSDNYTGPVTLDQSVNDLQFGYTCG